MTLANPQSTRRTLDWAGRLAVVGLSFWTALLLRFEFFIPADEWRLFQAGFFIVLVVKTPLLLCFHPRLDLWCRDPQFPDLTSLFKANLLASATTTLVLFLTLGLEFPRSVYCLDFMICFLMSGGIQFGRRLCREERLGWRRNSRAKEVLIYGAGVAGLSLAREIRCNAALGYRVAGFLDDDPRKQGVTLLGLDVLGTGGDARHVVEARKAVGKPTYEIVVSMPSASGRQIRAAVDRGRRAGVPCRIVPGLGELISGKLRVNNMQEISVTDLLGRERVRLGEEEVGRAILDKVVLVTGAAGSIGSELCSQLAQLSPRQLVAVDQAESELFRLEADIRERYPALRFTAEIADVRDYRSLECIIERFAVDSIFHAAAYKHVPVMERHVCEAVHNNVIGTWNVVQAAWRLNVERFLLISTDKAVNPSSVMGLTKRAAELIVSAVRAPVGNGQATRFVCVRFGNVLVSNGSVVPTFQKQIVKGGPVTVTHPDVRRYFMTVQEAVQLVLRASTMGTDSEIFVLDMGTPVRIVELARRMITLAGLSPDEDIEIRYTGLRPGEKLFEELCLDSEDHLPTSNSKIRVFRSRRLAYQQLVPWITELEHELWRADPEAVIEHLTRLVPEYQPPKPVDSLRGESAAPAVRAFAKARPSDPLYVA